MYGMYYDPTYFLIIIAMLMTVAVQFYMQSTFNKYQKISSKSGLTASDAARLILQRNGINNVEVGRTGGNLTDHYAPKEKKLNLSDTTYASTSIAAIGVAAHEAGHAIQDHKKMAILNFQMSMVPVVNFASKLSIPLLFIGMIVNRSNLIWAGVILFSATTIYTILLLPIEFNASHNAIITLRENGLMDEQELDGVKKVLTAAALTYVAAAATSIIQLLRFVLIANNSKRRR